MVATGPQSDFGLALALGGLTKGVSVLELTSAFGVFPIRASGGASRHFAGGRQGWQCLEDNTTARKEAVLKPEVDYDKILKAPSKRYGLSGFRLPSWR